MDTITLNINPCIYYPEYGLLYNWYAATDAREIANTGWHVPTIDEIKTLCLSAGEVIVERGNSGQDYSSGEKLMEAGFIHWNENNTGTNELGMSLVGSGGRIDEGFDEIKRVGNIWSSDVGLIDELTTGLFSSVGLGNEGLFLRWGNTAYYEGYSIRLLMDNIVGWTDGDKYTGNDGKVYNTVKIGTQVWLADNLSETKFRNGDIIPWHGANPANYFTNAEWVALTTSGCCAYNNDVNNVAPDFSFPLS